MSEKNLTPAEAWGHLSSLLGQRLDEIRPSSFKGHTDVRIRGVNSSLPIILEWPSGVDRWPPIEKPRRPAKMPEDYGKKAWFRNGSDWPWVEGVLCGYCPLWSYAWCGEDGKGWDHCEVECDTSEPAGFAYSKPTGAAPTYDTPVEPATEPEPEWITPTRAKR